jgi:hypothetical protein
VPVAIARLHLQSIAEGRPFGWLRRPDVAVPRDCFALRSGYSEPVSWKGRRVASRATDAEPQFLYSPAVRVSANATFGLGSNLLWDAYQRSLYNKINAALDRQASLLRQRGLITQAEVRALVEQRNKVLIEARKPLSPFGRLYSELLKPSKDLPTFERLVRQKGSIEAAIQSVGKTRATTNQMVATFKVIGRGTVVLQMVFTVVLVVRAKPEDRARVMARQGGSLAGAAAGGWAGAWAGCAGASLLASPSLALPVVGEITTGGACLVGGIVGGLGLGALGAWGGEQVGATAYDYVTKLTWVRR